jgi:hypothetical protein
MYNIHDIRSRYSPNIYIFNTQSSIGYENIKLRIISNIKTPCGTCRSSKRTYTLMPMAGLTSFALKRTSKLLGR